MYEFRNKPINKTEEQFLRETYYPPLKTSIPMQHSDGTILSATTSREMDGLMNEGFVPVAWQNHPINQRQKTPGIGDS